MSTRRKRVISTDEIKFNHKPAKMLLTEKKKGVSQNGQTPNIIGIRSYCVLDRIFEWNQVLLHPELTPWWSFIFADGAYHKKPCSPTHPKSTVQIYSFCYLSSFLLSFLPQNFYLKLIDRNLHSLIYSSVLIIIIFSLIQEFVVFF